MNDDEFEWDNDKAESNLVKHEISFEAGRQAFDNVFAVERDDVGGMGDEARYVITGMVNGILLTVVYTERSERIRIISARKATRHEHREYYRSQAAG